MNIEISQYLHVKFKEDNSVFNNTAMESYSLPKNHRTLKRMNQSNMQSAIIKHFESWCAASFNTTDIKLCINSEVNMPYSVSMSPNDMSFVLSDVVIFNEAMSTGKSVRKITHEKLDEALEFIYNVSSEKLIIEYPALQQYLYTKLGI